MSTLLAPATQTPIFHSTFGPITDPQGLNAVAPGANVAEVQVVTLFQAARITKVQLTVVVSSGNVDVGIYDDDGTAGAPGTLLASSGSTACPGAGLALVTLSSPVTLAPGKYYAAAVFDNGTAQLRYSTQFLYAWPVGTVYYTKTSNFPLGNITAPSAGSSPNGILIYPVST